MKKLYFWDLQKHSRGLWIVIKKKCIICGDSKSLIPTFKRNISCGDEDDYSGKVICEDCLRENEDYGICGLCNEDAAYNMKDLREYQCELYCKEHYSEIVPEDDMEEEDWNSFAEYILDPSHQD